MQFVVAFLFMACVFQENQNRTAIYLQKGDDLSFSVAAVETRATAEWKQFARFPVDAAAEDLVAIAFTSHRPSLEGTFDAIDLHEPGRQKTFTAALVRAYWSRLRVLATKRGAKTIDSATVKQLDPVTFLNSMQFNSPTGELLAESKPDGAEITIDGRHQDERTNSTFIVSANRHRVLISKGKQLRCDETVSVIEGTTVVVSCR